MTRVILAAIGGAIVGAILAGGICLLTFAYPLRAEVTNFPTDEAGALRIGGSIQATFAGATAQAGDAAELTAWGYGQTLQCICSEAR
jgi:hypothetical protein